MRRAVIIITVVFLLLSFNSCKTRTVKDNEKLADYIKAISVGYEDYEKEKASALLKEVENIVGTAEFTKIKNTAEGITYIDCIVCFTLTDGTKYFALYCRFTDGLVLLRIRKDNYIDGEVIWRRPEEGCVLSEVYLWQNYCVAVLEQKAGYSKFSLSYRLEILDSGGNWKLLADVIKDNNYRLGEDKRKVYFTLPEGLTLQSGHYRMTIPVTYTPADEKDWVLELDLSCEFNIT